MILRAIATGLLLTVLAAAPGWAGDEEDVGRFQIFTGFGPNENYGTTTDRGNGVFVHEGAREKETTFMVDTVTGQTWVFQPDSEDGKWRWRKVGYEGFPYNCYWPEACD
jgi:hypothetical protein